MRIEDLEGKYVVRTKPREYYSTDYSLGIIGRKVIEHDASYCKEPIKVLKVKNDVVYIEQKKFNGKKEVRILTPVYKDENWSEVDLEILGEY